MNCLICKNHRKMPIKARKVKALGLRIGCVKPVKAWMNPRDIMCNYPLYFDPGSIIQPCPNFEADK